MLSHLAAREALAVTSILTSLCVLFAAPPARAQFRTEPIGPSGPGIVCQDLAADSSGRLHVAYTDSIAGTLGYALNANGVWTSQTIAAIVGPTAADIEVDATGLPHIAFIHPSLLAIVYMSFDGSSWSSELASPQFDAQASVSLRFDGSGDPHVAYDSSVGGVPSLKIATRSAGVWTTQLVGQGGESPSLAINASGDLLVCHDAAPMKLSIESAGSWTTEDVGAYPNSGPGVLTLDPSGAAVVAFAYHEFAPFRFQVIRRNALNDWTSWISTSTQADSISATSVARAGNLYHFVYEDAATGSHYVMFQPSTLYETASLNGTVSALALDPSADVHMAGMLGPSLSHTTYRFVEIAAPAVPWAQSISWADLDGDGDEDAYVPCALNNYMLFNMGNGIFEPLARAPYDDANLGVASAWGDFDGDLDPDLYLANDQAPNRLFRNDGGGNFRDVTPRGLDYSGACRDVAWLDYDNDGDLDLYLANFGEPNILFRNDGGQFTDVTTAPLDDAGPTIDVAWADTDGDGDPDLYLVQSGADDKFLRNMGGVFFVEFVQSFTTDTRQMSFIDEDNDGLLDSHAAVAPTLAETWHDFDSDGWVDGYSSNEPVLPGYSPNEYWANQAGSNLQRMAFGPLHLWSTETSAVSGSDFDGDGDVDLAVVLSDGSGIRMFRNDTTDAHWIDLKLHGHQSPSQGEGARVAVTSATGTQTRWVGGGNGYRGHDPVRAHFGLGTDAGPVSVRIEWPSGIVQSLPTMPADLVHDVEESGVPVVPAFSKVYAPGFYGSQIARGSSWVDYDLDGDLDLLPTHLFQLNPILRNDGANVFTEVPIAPLNASGNSSVTWGDYDNDGDEDALAPTSDASLPVRLYRNDGSGTFTDVTAGALATAGAYRSASWIDFDQDGLLDVFVHADAGTILLIKNSGSSFVDVTSSRLPGPVTDVVGYSWCDVDIDGDADLFVFRNSSANSLYENRGDGYLENDVATGPLRDLTLLQGTIARADPMWVDYDSDGDFDLHLVLLESSFSALPTLLRNNGGQSWTDVTQIVLGPIVFARSQGWFDADNDGLLDLLTLDAASDRVDHRSGPASFDESIPLPVIQAAGAYHSLADYDADGDVDIFEVSGDIEYQLLENNISSGNHWLEVALQGTTSNRSGIGATVRVVVGTSRQIQSLPIDGPAESENAPRLHFGLGQAATADSVIVMWPTGFPQFLTNVAADQILTIVEDYAGSPFVIEQWLPAIGANGVAIGDYDDDRLEDVYFTIPLQPNVLMRGEAFQLTATTPPPLANAGNGRGAAWADANNDGLVDLYLVNADGPNHLFANLGGGAFLDVSDTTTGNGDAGQMAVWGDYDLDGFVDLYLVNASTPNVLLRNTGSGYQFVDVTPPLLADAGFGSGAAWGDYDSDGDGDLYLVNRQTANKLFRNDGGSFVDVTTPTLGAPKGTGAAWGDFDNDEDLDLLVTANNGTSMLYRNLGGGSFEYVLPPEFSGTSHSEGGAWGDFDNDGYLDIYTTAVIGWLSTVQQNRGGAGFRWVPNDVVTSSYENTGGKGCAWVDADRDGDLDLVRTLTGASAILMKNTVGSSRNWLRVKLVGTVSNASGIGARVRIVTAAGPQIREVSGGSGLYSQNPLAVHFGLGSADTVDSLEVRWPSGIVQRDTNVAGNRQLTIVESATATAVGGETTPVPGVTRLLPNAPNPFNPRTELRFDLAQAGRARIVVYDASGRRVATLLDEALGPGRHRTTWSGVDDHGNPVGSGVYFARLTASRVHDVRRVVLVR